MTPPPVLVEVERSGVVESVHRGLVVIVDEVGEVVLAVGEPDTAIYPRSALKPLQAAGMLSAGLELSGSWLALASASHSGESFHRAGVAQMLAAVGLSADDLQCPADWPYDVAAEREYVAAGHTASRVAMNCSGKHAAMLMTCVHRDWPVADYLAPDHPLQVSLRATIEELAGPIEMASTDGCGAPLWGLSLVDLARSFARLPAAAPLVVHAMQEFPEYVGGTTRDVSHLMRAVPTLAAKDGAEGVQAMSVKVAGRLFGVAVKIADGTDRARAVVAAAALQWLGVSTPAVIDHLERPVLGGGRPVGALRMAPGALPPRM